jgi:hypothetical protein
MFPFSMFGTLELNVSQVTEIMARKARLWLVPRPTASFWYYNNVHAVASVFFVHLMTV